MRRRRRVPGQRDGLFSWAPASGEVVPGELLVNPLVVECDWPPCRAAKFKSCVDIHGRKRSPHPSRRDKANAAARARQP